VTTKLSAEIVVGPITLTFVAFYVRANAAITA